MLDQVLFKRVGGSPGRMLWGSLSDDESRRLWNLRLSVVIIYTVVSDEWIGHQHMLSSVRRVCQDLLIARHGGIEHDLSQGGPPSTKLKAVEVATILEKKVSQFAMENSSQ